MGTDVTVPNLLPRAVSWVQAGRAPRALPEGKLLRAGGIACLALILLAAAVVSGVTLALDTSAELAVHAHAIGLLDAVLRGLTLLGAIPVVVGIVVVSGALLIRVQRRAEAVGLAAFMAGQGVVDDVLKLAVHRPRPQLFAHAPAHGFSFPSGHAMTTVCLGAALLFLVWPRLPASLRWVVAVAVALIVAGVGVSRVYLGVHYPSDVLGGWLAGMAWLGIAPRLLVRGASSVTAAAPTDPPSTSAGSATEALLRQE